MWGILGRIQIRRVHFHRKHVDLVWYGRRGIKRRIKRDCRSFP
jgi:hypothetical protein